MLRYAVTILFLMSGTRGTEEEHPMIEYLRNFDPGVGNAFDNMVNSLRQGLSTGPSSADGPFGRAEIGESGQAHVSDANYTFTDWSNYGECTKVCGGGSRERTRSCLNDAGQAVTIDNCFSTLLHGTYDLYKIFKYGGETKERDGELCNKQDCVVSEWKLEKSCSQKCGGGVMTYSRTCMESSVQQDCNFQSKKLVPCNTKPCFRLGEWQEWSRCTVFCGGGRSSRKRTCEPNVPSYSPLYQELLYALEHVTKSPDVLGSIDTENEAFYFSQFLQSCTKHTVQTKFCNSKSCPKCPPTQVFHQCKPCTRICRKYDLTNILNIKLKMPRIRFNPSGCGGICTPGCACPVTQPVRGFDERCYIHDLQCPQNQISQAQRDHMIRQLLLSSFTTTAPPASLSYRRPDGSAVIEDTTAALTTTTELASTTTSQPDMCLKDIPYLRNKDHCVCEGVKKDVPCIVGSPGQSCPFICTSSPTCPDVRSPRVKSTFECGQQECKSDQECSDGFLCCEILCGKRCIAL